MAEESGFINEIDTQDNRKQCAICGSRHCACDMYPCDMCKGPCGELMEFEQDDFNGTCVWCGEDFDQSLLVRTDLGYMCDHCIAAIRSRGESVTVYKEDRL